MHHNSVAAGVNHLHGNGCCTMAAAATTRDIITTLATPPPAPSCGHNPDISKRKNLTVRSMPKPQFLVATYNPAERK